MKKIVAITLISIIGFLNGCSEMGSSPEESISEIPIHQSAESHTDYVVPENMEEIERRSEDIVRVRAVQVEELGESVQEEIPYTNTRTTVEVIESFRGSLEAGEQITIAEPYYLLDGELVFVGDYIPMEMDEDYILFLYANDQESYTVVSIGYEKYHAEKEALEGETQDFNTVNDIQPYGFLSTDESQVDLYSSIHSEVLNKYGE